MYPTIQLFNHVSAETAYLVPRFPYLHGKNSSARYWVESKDVYGQRAMYQFKDPNSNAWFKPKTDGYFDLVIMEAIAPDSDPSSQASLNAGHVVIRTIDLVTLPLPSLLSFAQYYVFTPFQKERIMKALATHSIYVAPAWRASAELDYDLNKRAETVPTPEQTVLRKTDANGIPIQSAEDALKAERRAAREQQPSRQQPAAPKLKPGEVDISTLSPEQLALYNELMGN